MTQESSSILALRVTDYLGKSQKYVSRHRHWHGRIVVTSLLASGATTVVTGVTAGHGPVVGSGPAGWQLACIVASVLGFISTVTVGLNQELQLGARATKGLECVGRLRALEMALLNNGRQEAEIAQELAGILQAYTEVLES